MCLSIKCILGMCLILFPYAPCDGLRSISNITIPPLTKDSFTHTSRMSWEFSSPERKDTVKDIKIRFYNTPDTTKYVELPLPRLRKLASTPGFKRGNPVTVYLHGFVELFSDISQRTIIDGYLRGRPEINLLMVDYGNMGFGNYFLNAVPKSKLVGTALGTELLKLVSPNSVDYLFPSKDLHLVGHSLGAQISGAVGRAMKKAGHIVDRITALDAAFPGFYAPLLMTPPLERLSPADASFVVGIHTASGSFGAPLVLGHVDFWPNGGTQHQPGCGPVTVYGTDEDLCSHERSWWFWADSLLMPNSFPAKKCSNYRAYLEGKCRGKPTAVMGYDTSKLARGNYYLKTNPQRPFSMPLG